ncbi:unnamed protein product [Adineta ricciae]|uniref:NHL repeat containing protein-like protein n=1 Tax=Adineta ricciae TaxID=249248 RepID=A0A815V982_ADIRI|nr:unnamed protein product [Adineta ricciae]
MTADLFIREVFYNQPKLSPDACWNPDGITFAVEAAIDWKSSSLFVERSNTVYVLKIWKADVREWREGSTTVTIFGNWFSLKGLFVSIDGDIHVDNDSIDQVEEWTLDARKSVIEIQIISSCWGLFVDIANYLYCSLFNGHQVVKHSLNVSMNMETVDVVAGNGTKGPDSNMLATPKGIFVSINFDLYVADSENDRVQLFKFGQLDGITVAGRGVSSNISLYCPTAIFMDADEYLFIVDQNNHRIIRSAPDGFRCLVGCSGVQGEAPNQLAYPSPAAFDRYGNIFVADLNNMRIQKFILVNNTSNTPSIVQSMYSSELTADSQMYLRHGKREDYYYEAIQVNFVDSGCYILVSNSTVDTYGYLYTNNFNLFNPSKNLFLQDDNLGGGDQFKFTSYLDINTTYILVVTTSASKMQGNFSISASGSNKITLTRISEYLQYLLNN